MICSAMLVVLASAPGSWAQQRFPLPPEPPAQIPNATTIPTYRDSTALPDPGDAPRPTTAPRIIPNGNGTNTVIYPDGSVKIVPAQH